MELRIHPLAVIGTFLWRLTIAGFAFWGWWLYGHEFEELVFLTQSGNLIAEIVYAAVAAYGLIFGLSTGREPATTLPRGAMALLLMVVGCTYVGYIGGDTSEAKDLLTHVVTPALVFADWSFVGRSQNRVRWWHPLPWLVIPTVWLLAYTVQDGFSDLTDGWGPIYDWLDPSESNYPGIFAGLVAATIVGGYVLYAIGKVKGAISMSIRGEQGPPPGQRPPYQQPYQQQWQPGPPWQQPGPPQPQPQPQYGAPQGWQQPPRQPQQQPWGAPPDQAPTQLPPQGPPWQGPPR